MTHAANVQDYHARVTLRSAEEQARAFADAYRHSRRVRMLKRAIVLGSSGIVLTLIAYALIDPFSKLPKDVSIAKATLNGTRITMEHPKLSGFRKDGRPYELRARSGVQDIRKPKIIELNDIEATIRVNEDDTVRVTAPGGVFDSASDLMQLNTARSGDRIRIRGPSYSLLLQSARIDFKAGAVKSGDPVSLQLQNGSVLADTLDVVNNGKQITFVGNVRSVLKPPQGGAKPGPKPGLAPALKKGP